MKTDWKDEPSKYDDTGSKLKGSPWQPSEVQLDLECNKDYKDGNWECMNVISSRKIIPIPA